MPYQGLVFLLLFELCACVRIDMKTTVTFDVKDTDPSPETEEYMLFYTIDKDGDGPRSMDTVCAYQCETEVLGTEWNAKEKKFSVSISIYIMWSGEPWLYGYLYLCWGDRNTFRQFPAVLRDQSKWNCKMIVFDNRILQPFEPAMDPLSLGVFTWFMSMENYNQLRVQDSTEVLVPLSPDETYDLPVFIVLFHDEDRGEIQCTLQRPDAATPTKLGLKKAGKNVWHYTRHLTKIKFLVEAETEKSGTYTISCLGPIFHPPDYSWIPTQIKKYITLRFEEVPKIKLVGHAGNTVYFPHSYDSGEFYLNMYSTSEIVMVHISRSDGVRTGDATQLLTEFLGHHYYQLLAKYRVSIPWLEEGITGSYTVKMTNEQGQTASLGIRLHKVEELVVLVSPTRQEAEEGSTVTFQCLVLTDLPPNTTVTWEHGSHLIGEPIESRELDVSGNRKAIEMSLSSVNFSHSGIFKCVANNSFQSVVQTVSLTIYPAGAPNYKPQQKATWVQRMDCDKVIDRGTVENMKKAGSVVAILVCVVVALAIGAFVGWKVYQRVKDMKLTWPQSSEAQEVEKNEEERDDELEGRANEEDELEVINSQTEETQPLLQSSKKERKSRKKADVEVDNDLEELLASVETASKSPGNEETSHVRGKKEDKKSEQVEDKELDVKTEKKKTPKKTEGTPDDDKHSTGHKAKEKMASAAKSKKKGDKDRELAQQDEQSSTLKTERKGEEKQAQQTPPVKSSKKKDDADRGKDEPRAERRGKTQQRASEEVPVDGTKSAKRDTEKARKDGEPKPDGKDKGKSKKLSNNPRAAEGKRRDESPREKAAKTKRQK